MQPILAKAIFLLAMCGGLMGNNINETEADAAKVNESESLQPKSVSQDRVKTKELKKPSFIPYCVTRDVCKPVCDCAVYEGCEVLEMNADVRNKILIAINTARDIQTHGEPQASGMPKIDYDMELEEISMCWAARCEDEYSECFRTPREREATQTVGLLPLDLDKTELPLEYWDRTIQIWLGEVRKTNAEVVSSLPAGMPGEDVHSYAQILADRVKHVGCAWSRYRPATTSGDDEKASIIFVCTFTPRGPRQGEPIYKTGKACDTCEEGYKCSGPPFPYLCKKIADVTGTGTEQTPEPKEGKMAVEEEAPEEQTTKTARAAKPAARSVHIASGTDRCAATMYIVMLFLSLLKLIH